jgi:hypothetical protein
MTKLLQLLPQARETTAAAVIEAARKAEKQPLPPDLAKNYCADLSKLLLSRNEARAFPDLQALGFWLRSASIENMAERFLDAPEGTRRAPAGIVFQLPPGNVASLFGYTSSIALLCGNAVLVRLPSAPHPAQIVLTDLMRETLERAAPALAERLILLRYDHDDAITQQLSLACDVRLVWGSDATVDHIRRLPLPALARHISFGDRFSALAIKADYHLALDEAARTELVTKLFNDIYLFDQMACSSPRLLVWVGNEDASTEAGNDFYPRLAAHALAKNYQIGAAENIAKLNASYLALYDLSPTAYKVYAPQLSVITLPDLARLAPFKSVNYGHGMLLAARLAALEELARGAERRDQTLVCCGFDENEIRAFSESCRGRGFDRIVAAGQASAFNPVWDGYNLFDAMTRLIGVKP